MKRRELLMLVAGSGSVFTPPLLGGEHSADGITTPSEADDDAETIELTIELY